MTCTILFFFVFFVVVVVVVVVVVNIEATVSSFQVQPGYYKYLRPLMQSNKSKL